MVYVIILLILDPDNANILERVLIGVYGEKHRIKGIEALKDYCKKHNVSSYGFAEYKVEMNSNNLISLSAITTE